jgi:hypothetical protein
MATGKLKGVELKGTLINSAGGINGDHSEAFTGGTVPHSGHLSGVARRSYPQRKQTGERSIVSNGMKYPNARKPTTEPTPSPPMKTRPAEK